MRVAQGNLQLEKRVIKLSKDFVNSKGTVRKMAKKHKVSKSTVHIDLSKRIYDFDENLALEVRELLRKNKQERHIRGGNATKKMYAKKKKTI